MKTIYVFCETCSDLLNEDTAAKMQQDFEENKLQCDRGIYFLSRDLDIDEINVITCDHIYTSKPPTEGTAPDEPPFFSS